MAKVRVPSIDRSGSTPLYAQLADLLRDKIDRREWKSGQRIPSENELARIHGISRMTVRQVLDQLVKDELLFRVQGKGTYVAHDKIAAHSPAYLGIREQLERMGYPTSTRILSTDLVPADPRIATQLHLSPNTPVHRIRRVRLIDDTPISLHQSYVPESLAPHLDDHDLAGRQLCEVLETEYDLQMSVVKESLESTLPAGDEAKALRVRRTAPLLLLRQDVLDPAGREFEYTQILFRGDKIRLEFHYGEGPPIRPGARPSDDGQPSRRWPHT